jgi:hypothetical protein
MPSVDERRELRTIGVETLERWRTAMANGDRALVGQLVNTAHVVRDAERALNAGQQV